jgi:hypothetical protein
VLNMRETCSIHPDTELVVVKYCPACRGQAGGEIASAAMTAKQRSSRARKAVKTRWANAKKKAKEKKA